MSQCHKHSHTHTDTDTQTHSHTQTHRHTDTQTHSHTDTQTHTHTHTRMYSHFILTLPLLGLSHAILSVISKDVNSIHMGSKETNWFPSELDPSLSRMVHFNLASCTMSFQVADDTQAQTNATMAIDSQHVLSFAVSKSKLTCKQALVDSNLYAWWLEVVVRARLACLVPCDIIRAATSHRYASVLSLPLSQISSPSPWIPSLSATTSLRSSRSHSPTASCFSTLQPGRLVRKSRSDSSARAKKRGGG